MHHRNAPRSSTVGGSLRQRTYRQAAASQGCGTITIKAAPPGADEGAGGVPFIGPLTLQNPRALAAGGVLLFLAASSGRGGE